MKHTLTLLAIWLLSLTGFSQGSGIYNLRSDTVDILHYQVNLNITDFSTNTINGNCKITLSPKMASITSVSLDLLKLIPDSVIYNGNPLTTSYNDTLLLCYFSSPVNDADTIDLTVYYHGAPVTDPTWGGFYYQSGYAYNLGVGFTSIPHNFGRVFHPCFDNFVERATYDFNITTNGGKVAYCNGYLESSVTSGSDVTRHWVLTDPIPSYLACVAVNAYTHVNQKYISAVTADTTPIMLISLPGDTTNFKTSFVNLPVAMDAYEVHFGDYEWDKIGYVAVPFSSGAMEHATCIAYPKSTLIGTTYQHLMAHELSHHWWGDLVTCETAEDMWINEGMARWSEALFLEHLVNYASYLSNIRANHKSVVWKAHVDDGGWYPISGVPQSVTYGTTTYNKGADVVHTLRGYLGDSLFFAGLHSIINNYKFKNINAAQFRDHLNTIPGVNVTNFFDDWVFQPGFPEFAVDSFKVVPSGPNFDVTVYSKQKTRNATHLATGVPMQVSFRDNNFNVYTSSVSLSGSNQVSTVTGVPFNPAIVFFNEDEKISEAVTTAQLTVTTTGTKNFSNANFTLNVQAISDTVWARVEHHWVAADDFNPSNFLYTISPDRFWRVQLLGDVPGMYAKATINYNGSTSGAGYLDNGLVALLGSAFHEDSLELFYRKDASENWQLVTNATFTIGGATDKVGVVSIDSVKAGDYAFGIKTSAIGISERSKKQKFALFPNPASNTVSIELQGEYAEPGLMLSDISGNLVRTYEIKGTKHDMNVEGLSRGTYLVSLTSKGRVMETRKLILK